MSVIYIVLINEKSMIVSDSSSIKNDGFEDNNNKPKWIELITDMRQVSLEKIKNLQENY